MDNINTKLRRQPRAPHSLGAPMGRTVARSAKGGTVPADARFTLQRVRVNSQGYDAGGSYWGAGQPLWYAGVRTAAGYAEDYFRAADRAAAKAHVRAQHPGARFYR